MKIKPLASLKASMKTLIAAMLLTTFGFAHAQDNALQLKMSGSIEVGGNRSQLTDNFGSRHSSFVRGEFATSAEQRFNAEVANISEFGNKGTLFVLGLSRDIDADNSLQLSVASSEGSMILPRLRMDVGLSHKWLEEKNLVTSFGLTKIESKDQHRDFAFQLSSAYYTDIHGLPTVFEVNARHNESNPGSVGAWAYSTSISIGNNHERIVSLRLDQGKEAYQAIGNGTSLVGFQSNGQQLSWREWITSDSGLQFRLTNYKNPFYRRHGIDISYFKEF